MNFALPRAVGKESKKLKKVIKRVVWADEVGWTLTICWEHSSREEATLDLGKSQYGEEIEMIIPYVEMKKMKAVRIV